MTASSPSPDHALALRHVDLQAFEGEARVRDLRVGEALGIAQPINIRKVIRKNMAELLSHGEVISRREITSASGGRPATEFYLNEAQVLVLCMFSRTALAVEVRRQVITVFMAWRHGQLVSADEAREAPWSALERRIGQLELLVGCQAMVETESYAVAVTYSPPVFRLRTDDGRLRGQRYPKFWHDLPVREAAIRLHRQTTIAMAVAQLAAEFGKERAPSKSALQRFWKQLDLTRGVGITPSCSLIAPGKETIQ